MPSERGLTSYNGRIPDGAPSVIKTTIEGSTAWKDPNNNFLRVRNVRDEVRVVQGNLDAFGDAKSVSGVPVAAWAINGVQRLFLSGSEVSDMDVAVEKLLTPFIRNI